VTIINKKNMDTKNNGCGGNCSCDEESCDRAKPYSGEEVEAFIGKFSQATEEEREDIMRRLKRAV